VVLWPDARLSQVAQPALGPDTMARDDLDRLIADMCDTMYAALGRGLAAPQIGVARRVFVMDATWKTGASSLRAFVDPVPLAASDEVATLDEGCLSIPGRLVAVTRPARVTLAWHDADGMRRTGGFDGFAAACVQHEIDHLDGILTLDRAGLTL
jgi:peptide deformylase